MSVYYIASLKINYFIAQNLGNKAKSRDHDPPGQRVDTIKREMFSQKSVRRFVSDSSAFVMGAMFLASALNRGISPRY